MQDSSEDIFLFQEEQQGIDGNDVSAEEGDVFRVIKRMGEYPRTDDQK